MDVVKVDHDVAYVAMVIHLCCKRLSPNVSSVFFKHMFQVCFIQMLHMFHIYSVCCKCFIWMLLCFAMAANIFFLVFRTYVASVFYICYKSRSSVAHVALGPICSSHLLQLMGPPAVRACHTKRHRPRYRRRTRCGASTHMKRASGRWPRPDVWTLDVSILFVPGHINVENIMCIYYKL
jgi:hypothetical protein